MRSKQTFGECLKQAAGQRNLTLSALALRARVHVTNVSKIANNHRPCGLSMAVRLADALGLGGPERFIFLQHASATTNRTEVILDKAHCGYPAELRDLVVNYLSSRSIYPDDIEAVEGSACDGTTTIRLRAGTRIALRIATR